MSANEESCEGMLNFLLSELRNAKQALMSHNKPLENWPSGKSTVDHNIRGYYKKQRVIELRGQIAKLEDKCWNNK